MQHAAEVFAGDAELTGGGGDDTAGGDRGFAFDFPSMTCHGLKSEHRIRAVQHENQSDKHFSERTDALATALNISLRDLAERIGISQAMLFAYRTGKQPISAKAWRKLEDAEARARSASAIGGERSDSVEEAAAPRYAQGQSASLPEWWCRLPSIEDWERSRELVPRVYERLKIAAERTFMGDLAASRGRKRSPDQIRAFTDALADLGVPGTRAAMQPEFEILIRAYSHELLKLRSEPLEERLAIQAREIVRQRSIVEKLQDWWADRVSTNEAPDSHTKPDLDTIETDLSRAEAKLNPPDQKHRPA